MPSRNVFKFVAPRPPKYVEPERDPEIFYAVMIAFLPDPPDSTIPQNPLPVPLVTDPEAERRFFAAVNTPSSADPEERRLVLVEHAATQLSSEQGFDRDPDWRALRRAEPALRQLLSAHGPDLELSPDARWVQGVWAVISQVMTGFERLAAYLQSDRCQSQQNVLWNTLYALTVVEENNGNLRSSIMFWLRLLTILKRVQETPQPGQFLRFAGIPISVPRVLAARLAPPTDDTPPQDAENDAARLDQIEKIEAQIAALEAAAMALERADEAAAVRVTGKIVERETPYGKSMASQQISANVIAEQDDETDDDAPAVSIDAALLSQATIATLQDAGISIEGRAPDDIEDDIEDRLGALEGQRDDLSKRTELILRGSILVKRVVSQN